MSKKFWHQLNQDKPTFECAFLIYSLSLFPLFEQARVKVVILSKRNWREIIEYLQLGEGFMVFDKTKLCQLRINIENKKQN